MSTSVTQSNTKKERPKSSAAQMLTATATVYNGFQLKELNKGQQEIIKNTQQVAESNLRQEKILDSIDYGVRNLEQLSIERNEISSESLDIQKEQLKIQKLDSEERRARNEIKDLKEELEEQKTLEIQGYRDITYSIFREQQLILETSMTNLEKYFTLQKLYEIIKTVRSEFFVDTSDRTYRDETEDEIRAKIKNIQNNFSKKEKTDLQMVIEIEEKDENEQAEILLEKVKKREVALAEAKKLTIKVKKFKGLTDAEYKEIKRKIKTLLAVIKAK